MLPRLSFSRRARYASQDASASTSRFGRGRGDDEEADLGGAEDDEEEKEKEEKEPLKYFARGAEQEPQCVCRCEGSTRAER